LSDLVRIGRVGKPHGLDGSFVVEHASADARWFETGARFLAGGAETEVVVARHARGRPVVKLDREVARGSWLEVERTELSPTADGEFYVFELRGLEVVEEGGRVLGKVADVAPGIANDVLELDTGAALPMVEDCVRDIDLAAGRILVARGFTTPD
jgi:16S rRNA processing protein RimM